MGVALTKYLGLVSFLILVAGLLFTVLRWKGGLHMTFSQHVARERSSTIYYSALFGVTLPLLYLFFADWFVPEFRLSGWFTALVAISVITQFLCTLVPEVGEWKTFVHRILTGISGISLLPLVMMIAVGPAIPRAAAIVAGICLTVMIVLLIVALTHQKGFRYALLLQVGYYLLFFSAVLPVAYL